MKLWNINLKLAYFAVTARRTLADLRGCFEGGTEYAEGAVVGNIDYDQLGSPQLSDNDIILQSSETE